jgi:hypothetical protein
MTRRVKEGRKVYLQKVGCWSWDPHRSCPSFAMTRGYLTAANGSATAMHLVHFAHLELGSPVQSPHSHNADRS